jgi:hypothetical protein
MRRMLDRLFFAMLGVAALALVGLAMVWPQGLGDRSPPPFGHTPVQRTPAVQAAMKRENEAAVKEVTEARKAIGELQTQAVAPGQ